MLDPAPPPGLPANTAAAIGIGSDAAIARLDEVSLADAAEHSFTVGGRRPFPLLRADEAGCDFAAESLERLGLPGRQRGCDR
ncbi:hypothetical protein [Falsiroseomonas oryziterrae]|uniref:hypothetical protein n=1 Tax=Falsiroseomonas oryziterrae TaxID=2911368 RepID=UPI001F16F24C|nr:hypothetical protein [Roseomonas sp. NPKOSM-4]